MQFNRMAGMVGAAAVAIFFSSSACATIVDLINNDSGTINGAIFEFASPASAPGVLDPFLRVQADGTEQGYNTSNPSPPFDAKMGMFTHDVTFAQLMTTEVTIGGVNYFTIILGINQTSNNPLLSLDQLQIYTGPTGSLNTTNLSLLGTLRYSFSPGDAVYLDASRHQGNSFGDMFAFIPVSAFAGTALTDFVYLYCHFGNTFATNGGFEEFALVVNPIPEASAFFPIVGLLAAVFLTQFVRGRQIAEISK